MGNNVRPNAADWHHKAAGTAMRTIGRSSDSIRLGLERGFDSGEMMDPQLKLIAATLNNREGKPWLMKNRPVCQVERWALDAGFEFVRSVLAPHGLYAVSVSG